MCVILLLDSLGQISLADTIKLSWMRPVENIPNLWSYFLGDGSRWASHWSLEVSSGLLKNPSVSSCKHAYMYILVINISSGWSSWSCRKQWKQCDCWVSWAGNHSCPAQLTYFCMSQYSVLNSHFDIILFSRNKLHWWTSTQCFIIWCDYH